ncbi:MAG: MCE family protein [Sedimentisphaerales bacterium]|nr:MCE family protein [Sedimentisphaerales bacterium]
MSTKPHYFRIGLFVILATLLIVVAVVTFGAGLLAQNRMYFETYFNESITGLSTGSPVEFRGVRIGQVEKIGFVGSEYDLKQDPNTLSKFGQYVRVVCSVARASLPEFEQDQADAMLGQMIVQGLRARVSSNILTGQAFLEADYLDPNRFPIMPVAWQPKYSYIPSAPSQLSTIKDSIDKILFRLQEIDVGNLVATLEQVLKSLDQAVVDADLARVSGEAKALLQETRQKVAALDTESINDLTQTLLVSLNRTVTDANVPALSADAQSLLAEARQTLQALEAERISRAAQDLLASLDRAVADANMPALSRETRHLIAALHEDADHLKTLLITPDTKMANLPEVLDRLDRALAHLDALIVGRRPEVEIILDNFRDVSDDLKELTESLKERPSELLFSKPPARSEMLK